MLTSLSIGRGGLGRFGNQAFTIASTIGIAIKSGQPYTFPRWQTHDNAIFGQPVDDIEQHLIDELPRIPEGLTFKDYGYFWGYRNIHLPAGNWTIDAHMQSERYFSHCIGTVREVFRFKDEPPLNDYVAIHYRAGDYIDDERAAHPTCSKEYYQAALDLLNPGTKCYVFSDDPYAAIQRIGKRGFEYPGGSYIDQFKLMKRCKHFITANSSFSLMAAILGEHPDKKIICPSRWFGEQMVEPYKSDTKDIYPENAIII